MTTIIDLIRDLSRLRPIDMEKPLTLNGMFIQGVSIKEYVNETLKTIVDENNEPAYKIDEDGNEIPLIDKIVNSTTKIVFTTGSKANEEFKTPKALLSALGTLTTKEKKSSVLFGSDNIFVLGDYTYSDRVNIDTDEELDEFAL